MGTFTRSLLRSLRLFPRHARSCDQPRGPMRILPDRPPLAAARDCLLDLGDVVSGVDGRVQSSCNYQAGDLRMIRIAIMAPAASAGGVMHKSSREAARHDRRPDADYACRCATVLQPERMRRVFHRTAHYWVTTLRALPYGGPMRTARAVTIKCHGSRRTR